jgi:hypothetical protein
MPEARSARKGTLRRGMKMGSISDLFKPNVENLKAKRDIKGLVNELQNTASSKTRLDAATALNELGWKPASDTERSYYLLGKQAWSELAAPRSSSSSNSCRETTPRLVWKRPDTSER